MPKRKGTHPSGLSFPCVCVKRMASVGIAKRNGFWVAPVTPLATARHCSVLSSDISPVPLYNQLHAKTQVQEVETSSSGDTRHPARHCSVLSSDISPEESTPYQNTSPSNRNIKFGLHPPPRSPLLCALQRCLARGINSIPEHEPKQ